jgi:hypothetical protein
MSEELILYTGYLLKDGDCVRAVKSRRLRWTGHVNRKKGDKAYIYNFGGTFTWQRYTCQTKKLKE